jgi:hypothetical protein
LKCEGYMSYYKDEFVMQITPEGAKVVRGGLAEKCYRAVLHSLNLVTGSVISVNNNDIIAAACFFGLREENLADAIKDFEIEELLIDTLHANVARARIAVKEGGPITDAADKYLVDNGMHRIEAEKVVEAEFAIRRSEDELNSIKAA